MTNCATGRPGAPGGVVCGGTDRTATRQRFLMCRPNNFKVFYSTHAWMQPHAPLDAHLAKKQGQTLYQTYLDLGHEVEVMADVPGLPDMVFTASAGIVRGDPSAAAEVTELLGMPAVTLELIDPC